MRIIWTEEDDRVLLENVERKGKQWRLIRKKCFMNRRSEDSIRNRYSRITQDKDVMNHFGNESKELENDKSKAMNKTSCNCVSNYSKKERWTQLESQALVDLILSNSYNSKRNPWKQIAIKMNRDVKGLRSRWSRMLISPDLCKEILLTPTQVSQLLFHLI